MTRILTALLPFLFASSAFAQAAAAEPPVEKANMFTVVVFLLVFVASIVGYFVYLWWTNRKSQREGDADALQK